MKKEYNRPYFIEVGFELEDVVLTSISKNELLDWGGDVNEIF